MTAKREKQLKQLAVAINAVVAAELGVYGVSVLVFPAAPGNIAFAFLSTFVLVSAACALANLIVLTLLVTRAKSIKQWQHRFAILLLAVSLLYLGFMIFPLATGVFETK
jgi:cytochrome bd-type quinol oxidase subunit 2